MAGFTDAMVIDGKAVIRKIRNGKSLRKGGAVNLEQCDIKITSTVQGGIITLEIPEKNLLITCRLQDVLAVQPPIRNIWNSNQAPSYLMVRNNVYHEIKQGGRGAPPGKESNGSGGNV